MKKTCRLVVLCISFLLSVCLFFGLTLSFIGVTRSQNQVIGSNEEVSEEFSEGTVSKTAALTTTEVPADSVHESHDGWTPLPAAGGYIAPGKYYLADDMSMTNKVTLSGGSSELGSHTAHLAITQGQVTLCLNGHVLRGDGTASLMLALDKGSIILCDCNSEHLSHEYYADSKGLYHIDDGTSQWKTAYASAQNKGTIEGGIVTGGGGVRNAGGFWVETAGNYITGGTIAGNTAISYTGGVQVATPGSSLVMSGGAVCGNIAPSASGGVIVHNNATFIMTGGEITNNYAPSYGGGLLVQASSVCEIWGGTITDNLTVGNGNNICIYSSGKVTVYGGNIGGDENSIYPANVSNVIFGGYFEYGDLENKTVANGAHVSNSMYLVDLGASAGKYRYHVTAIWTEQPSIEGWTYGDAAQLQGGAAEEGANLTIEYKPEGASDTEYKAYNASSSYPTEAGNYSMRFTVEYYGENLQQVLPFQITRRTVRITGVTAQDREYDGTTVVSLSGGELQNTVSGDDIDFSLGNGRLASADAGNAKQVTTSITLTGADAGNYSLTQPTDITVNIAPQGGLQLEKFELKAPAYIGMDLSDVTFECTVTDRNGTPVPGTAKWEISAGEVGTDNSESILFTPASSNYASAKFDVTFPGEYLTLTFDMTEVSRKLTAQIQYNQNYSAEKIRIIFNELFLQFLTDNADLADRLKNMTPKLDNVFVDEYDKDLLQVTENQTIAVTFEKKEYTVTFDADNGSGPVTESGFYYGTFIIEPDTPENNGKVFLGWYYEKPNEDGQGVTETKWDFLQDKVTENITLYAKWLDVDYVLDHITAAPNRDFEALEIVGDGDLTVTAHLTADGGYTQDIVLSWGDYTVTYASPDSILHVNNASITVSYKYGDITETAELNLTVHPIKVDVSNLKFESKSFEYDGNSHGITVVGQLPSQIDAVTYEYFKSGASVGDSGVTEVGTYTVKATLVVNDADYYADDMTATLTITRGVEQVRVEWVDEGYSYTGEPQHPQVHIYDADGNEITESLTLEYSYTSGDGIRAGNHTVQVIIEDTGYIISEGATCDYEIEKKQLEIPVFGTELFYDGTEQDVSANLEGYDADGMKLSGDVKKTNAGTYRLTVMLSDAQNYVWDAGTSVTVDWKIEKVHLSAEWDGFEFLYKEGTVYGPRVTAVAGIVSSDAGQVDYANDFVYSGDTEVGDIGAYNIAVSLNGDAAWTANYILDGNIDWSYVIVPKSGMTIITVEWQQTEFVYNGEVQYPDYKIYDRDGTDVTDTVDVVLGGDYKSSKWAGEYEVTVTVKDADTYFIRSGAVCKYTIDAQEDGTGGPTDPNYPKAPDDSGNQGGGIKLPENFPLWQAVVGGISLLLGIIFYARTGVNASRTKKFKKDTEKTQKSYSAAFAPIILLAGTYLGVTENIWTVIALSLAGLCVIGFIAMLATGHARKKAEVAYEDAVDKKNAELQRRRDEEQRKRDEAIREEQRRRDEELKMVLMAMMGNRGAGNNGNANEQQGPIYATGATVEEIVARTITALQPYLIADRSSANDERVVKLLEQQEKLIKKILEHPTEESKETDEEKEPDEEEAKWDEESDEEEVREVTPIEIVNPDGEVAVSEATVTKTVKLPANFRARLKISSEKNREAYVKLKNLLCAQKGVTFRVSGRVEKIKYKGEMIAVIGVATKHLKLWLSLDPNAYDRKRYFQKDVSDKVRYAQVPMLVKVGSERAEARAEELLAELFRKYGIARKRRYEDKNLQELAYTLKRSALVRMRKPELLCESIHVHDADVLTDEEAEQSVERRSIAPLGEEKFATVKLDTLDENFYDGQKVTLDVLKKKGLVGEEYNGYKVVAGTRLTKPLIVLANEFTTSAAKMLALTGGRAILLVQPFQPKFS